MWESIVSLGRKHFMSEQGLLKEELAQMVQIRGCETDVRPSVGWAALQCCRGLVDCQHFANHSGKGLWVQGDM